MDLAELSWWQWGLGAFAAMLCGTAKTGVPGLGILVVPLMAIIFGGKQSVGTLLPMLIFADCFAVCWYRRHAQWDKLWSLFPWVLPGVVLGFVVLWAIDGLALPFDGKLAFKPLIGAIVLTMLIIHLLRQRMGDRLVPNSPVAVAATGTGAGAATTLANAAGPIMTLYLAGMRLPKEQFMGTNAWFFLILNCAKVPLYLVLTVLAPQNPMFSKGSILFDLAMLPLIVVGVFLGKWVFTRIPQRLFDVLVLVLAGLSSINLLLSPWLDLGKLLGGG